VDKAVLETAGGQGCPGDCWWTRLSWRLLLSRSIPFFNSGSSSSPICMICAAGKKNQQQIQGFIQRGVWAPFAPFGGQIGYLF